MSQIFSYLKNILNPTSNTAGKRGRNEIQPEATLQPSIPKYRRVSNHFPKQYRHRIDDDIDHFNQVKQSRGAYAETLENFIMEQQNQQRQQFRAINDDCSDEDVVKVSSRVPALVERRMHTSGYNFSHSPQSPTGPASYRFSSGPQVFSTAKPSKKCPALVPITGHKQTQNGFNNGLVSPPHRRSVFGANRYRTVGSNSQNYRPKESVIERNRNLTIKQRYNNLLCSLIPTSSSKYSSGFNLKPRTQPMVTVDLSSDDTEPSTSATPVPQYEANRYSSFQSSTRGTSFQQSIRSGSFKKPSAFADVSDDEDFTTPIHSSTLSKKKDEGMQSSHRQSESSLSLPDVAPVNSLKQRQESRSCLHDDAIASIQKKYEMKRLISNTDIEQMQRSVAQLSVENSAHEKQAQRNIDKTITSLKQCIIIDDGDEAVNEFPQLTEPQLRTIQYALHGNRNEVVASKFSMNLTRNDLNTLDGLNWLNDEVINFYMELLKQRGETVEYLPKVYAMNTFFIPKLLSMGHSGVRRWTRKVDIFSFDIIPVPVHVGGVHWCMAIIDMRLKSISYYDSMGHPNMAVLDALEQYLQEESMDKRKIPFDTKDWKIECIRDCPQQRNGSDCGVFSCMFAEFLTRDSKISFDQQHMQYCRRKMVLEIVSGKLLLG